MPLAEGEVIDGYTIVRSIGAGGMGEVYLAQHPRLPRRDALKVLAATVCADSEYRQRFEREADIAATLWHPHIVEVHDRGDVDGRLWISMDYVEGTDAGELLTDRHPKGMPPDEVVRIVTAIGDALDYAHQRGLLHRDVKPANILIANPSADNERIMLADFGIARRTGETSNLTGTNMTVGTVAYSAPEQLTGGDVDGRADQYALAATAYQLLTGFPPFHNVNPAVVISQHLTAKPPPIGSRRPELSSLGPVFEKALAKAPADRYAKCIDFARALASCIGTPGALPDDSEATRLATATPAPSGPSGVSGPRHSKQQAIRAVAETQASGARRRGAGHHCDRRGGVRRLRAWAQPPACGGQAAADVIRIAWIGRCVASHRDRRQLCDARRRWRHRDRRARVLRASADGRQGDLVAVSGRGVQSDGNARPERRGLPVGDRGAGTGLHGADRAVQAGLPRRHPAEQRR